MEVRVEVRVRVRVREGFDTARAGRYSETRVDSTHTHVHVCTDRGAHTPRILSGYHKRQSPGSRV